MRRISQNLLLAGSSLLLTLGLVEVSTRIVAPQELVVHRPDIYIPDPDLGIVHRPNVQTEMNTGEGQVVFMTDERGDRVGATTASDAETEIVVLGDSFMEGLAVEYEETVSGRLEEQLRSVLGRPVRVRNTGVSGHDPRQYLERARRELARGEVDAMVVAVFPANDILFEEAAPRPAGGLADTGSSSLAGRVYRAVAKPANDFLRSRSHAYNLFRRGSESMLVRAGLLERPRYHPELFRSGDPSNAWDVTADVVARIDSLAAANQVPSLFVLIPLALEVDGELFEDYLRAHSLDSDSMQVGVANPRLRRLMEDRDLAVIDAQDALIQAQRGGSLVYGRVDPHLSAAGHRVVADLLVPELSAILQKGTDGSFPDDMIAEHQRIDTTP